MIIVHLLPNNKVPTLLLNFATFGENLLKLINNYRKAGREQSLRICPIWKWLPIKPVCRKDLKKTNFYAKGGALEWDGQINISAKNS